MGLIFEIPLIFKLCEFTVLIFVLFKYIFDIETLLLLSLFAFMILNKFDFESISLEEIENDFMAIKAKSEALKVENELLKILFEPSNIEKHNNFKNKMKKKLSPEENKCNINIQNKK